MALPIHIQDPRNKNGPFIDTAEGEDQALVVATRPLKTLKNASRYFSNSDYGVDMNVNATTSGTPLKIHDGLDSTLWTGTSIVGRKTTFNSGDRYVSGTHSVKTDNANINDVYQFTKVTGTVDMTGYTSISMYINVDKDWKAGDSVSIYGWDTSTGVQIGTEVYLENHFAYSTYDTWHKITIPLTEFGVLSSSIVLNSIRFQQISDEWSAPKYYIDDIQFEESGIPISFSIEPDLGTWLYITE